MGDRLQGVGGQIVSIDLCLTVYQQAILEQRCDGQVWSLRPQDNVTEAPGSYFNTFEKLREIYLTVQYVNNINFEQNSHKFFR